MIWRQAGTLPLEVAFARHLHDADLERLSSIKISTSIAAAAKMEVCSQRNAPR